MAVEIQDVKAPPVRKQGPRQSRAKAPASKPAVNTRANREEGLTGLFQLAAAGCVMSRNYADAGAIATHGKKIAAEAALLGDKFPDTFGKYLDFTKEVGPFAGLIMAVIPLGMQIMVNHKRIAPAPALAQFGVTSREAMEMAGESQQLAMEASYMRQHAEMLEEARQAKAEYERATAEEVAEAQAVHSDD